MISTLAYENSIKQHIFLIKNETEMSVLIGRYFWRPSTRPIRTLVSVSFLIEKYGGSEWESFRIR